MYPPLSKVVDYRFDNLQFICTFSKSVVVMLFLNDFEVKKRRGEEKKKKKIPKIKRSEKYFFSIVSDYTNLHTRWQFTQTNSRSSVVHALVIDA